MMNNKNIEIIKKGEREFPNQLYELKNCPKCLYAIGNLELLKEFSLAIVGARFCEEESAKYAKEISFDLAKRGVVIISGLANGIDSLAHQGCLEAQGKTIAVLGSGLEDIYPKENIRLFDEIIECGGLVLTEFAPNTPPLKHNFLMRNRIIAALSKGVVLIEAKEFSGSISTAKRALELNKKLFVIPGAAWDDKYEGSNKLLMEGAKCILTYEDVLKEYQNYEEKSNNNIKEELLCIKVPEEYERIYAGLSEKPKTINQLSIELKMPINEITYKLTLMEMDGFIKQLPGKCFKKVKT